MGKPLAVVSVSGGKDSTATALIAMDRMGRENCRFVFADTGNEHELTLEYVYDYMPTVFGPITTVKADFSRQIAGKRLYVENKWPLKGVPPEIVQRALAVLQPTGNPYLDMCIWKGRFPSRMTQFCTQELKRIPLDNYMLARMEEGWELSSWRGIRRDESQNRADAVEHERAAEGWDIEHPIVGLTAQEVVDFVLSRGVRLNPLYSMGMNRVGCMPCINCAKDELNEIFKRAPHHIDRIREWERLVGLASKRGWTTFFTDAALISLVEIPGWTKKWIDDDDDLEPYWGWIEPDNEIYGRLRIDKRVEWAQTARGGRQQDFIRQLKPACSSVYGLCE